MVIESGCPGCLECGSVPWKEREGRELGKPRQQIADLVQPHEAVLGLASEKPRGRTLAIPVKK